MIGIISDIHGNYPALMSVLEELDKIGCNNIVSLGDVCGYYCMVNECIEELRKRNIKNIMGNHDYYVVNNEKCGRSYTANLCLDYQREVITADNLEWLAQSVDNIILDNIWMVHGGFKDFLDEYIEDFGFLNCHSNIKIYVSGHTHVQKKVSGKFGIYVNPGSVGQPRDHLATAGYAVIYDEEHIVLGRTEYEIDRIYDEMLKAGFPERVSSCLYYGVKIGENER